MKRAEVMRHVDDGQACGNQPRMWPVGRLAWNEANQMEAIVMDERKDAIDCRGLCLIY